MKILADEGVDKPIVDALRKEGYDISYILEMHQGAADDFVLSIANTAKNIIDAG